ncbi:MAG TPA: DNA mismatch repair protein MutS, partial [Desulfurivibrionaceae bacterium]|nr:DNA mismatch repair protein MutS [Desulfurivibrionaceae bacterium]
LAALCKEGALWGVSLLDLSTGEFLVGEQENLAALMDELTRFAPSELLVEQEGMLTTDPAWRADLAALLPEACLTERPSGTFYPTTAREALLAHFRTINLAGFGCDHLAAGITAAGALLLYLTETQKSDLSHIERLRSLDLANVLLIDDSSRRNLELTQTIIGGKREGSLLATLDHTTTPMGARLLKHTLLFPLQDVGRISRRLDAVETLFRDPGLRQELRDTLTQVYDLERLNSRVVLGSANARDLTALRVSMEQLPQLKARLASTTGLLGALHTDLDELADLRELLHRTIREDAPVTLRDGNLIREGYHAELDELIAILRDGKALIAGLESAERAKSGIANLKIGYNKVFGYYLEVSRGQLANVPDHFIRKQTLVNAERFITPELKEFEQKVTGAEEKRLELEYRLFSEIRQQVAAASSRILQVARAVARLDLYAALAEVASRYHYVRPTVNEGDEIVIVEGRHPVIERSLPPGKFVPNDVRLDQTGEEVLIITGPNMAG